MGNEITGGKKVLILLSYTVTGSFDLSTHARFPTLHQSCGDSCLSSYLVFRLETHYIIYCIRSIKAFYDGVMWPYLVNSMASFNRIRAIVVSDYSFLSELFQLFLLSNNLKYVQTPQNIEILLLAYVIASWNHKANSIIFHLM